MYWRINQIGWIINKLWIIFIIILRLTSSANGYNFSCFSSSLFLFHNVVLRSNEVSVTDWRNISRLVPVICEKCSKRYPRNKFSCNFPSYTRKGPLRESLLSLSLTFSLFLSLISLAFAIRVVEVSREKGRELERDTRRHPWKDDRVGPLAIISLATTRQMSDYCETRRLVGRFSSSSRLCSYDARTTAE